MNEKQKSSHHITPRSRKGKTTKANLATLTRRDHQVYHALFDNKTPAEIIEYLVDYFWFSNEREDGVKFIYEYLKNRKC